MEKQKVLLWTGIFHPFIPFLVFSFCVPTRLTCFLLLADVQMSVIRRCELHDVDHVRGSRI